MMCLFREYMRVLPDRLEILEADGWRLVAASRFADGQISCLVVRP